MAMGGMTGGPGCLAAKVEGEGPAGKPGGEGLAEKAEEEGPARKPGEEGPVGKAEEEGPAGAGKRGELASGTVLLERMSSRRAS